MRPNQLSPGALVRHVLFLVTILGARSANTMLTVLEETRGIQTRETREMSDTSRASQVYSEQDVPLETSPIREGVASHFPRHCIQLRRTMLTLG